jgi:hypothetical protein
MSTSIQALNNSLVYQTSSTSKNSKLAFTPDEVKSIVQQSWPAVRELVNREAQKYGGKPAVFQSKFGTAREIPYFAQNPNAAARVESDSQKPGSTQLIMFNTGHPAFTKSTDKNLIQYAMTHEYMHAISADFRAGLLALTSNDTNANDPDSVNRSSLFRNAVNEGVTDFLTEQLTKKASPSPEYAQVRLLAKIIALDIGAYTLAKAQPGIDLSKLPEATVGQAGVEVMKKAFFKGDKDALQLVYSAASARVK